MHREGKSRPNAVIELLAFAAGAAAFGAVAIGALAIGRMAVGRMAIGRMAIRKARFGSLEVDELTVRRLRVIEQVSPLKHDPEKCEALFGKDHAQIGT